MEPLETPKIIEIQPRRRILSATELTKYRNVEIEPLRVGLKRTQPSGSQEDAEELRKLHAELRKQISLPRIERLAGRSLGEWDALEQAVCVTRKDGKFGNFGYSCDGKQYLEYFEAMFLLELGRLQLEYNGQIVSVEQAYILLLGEDASPKYNEYLAYSNFMRVGYILVRHQNLDYNQTPATPNDCVWAQLLNALQDKTIPSYIVQSPHYSKIQQSFEETKQRIRRQQGTQQELAIDDTTHINFECKMQAAGKRKATEMPADSLQSKRRCIRQDTAHHYSYLDQLKNEPEFRQFQNIFDKLDVIQLQLQSESYTTCRRDLKINFDLYLHNEGFKKSAPKAPPNFRLVLLQTDEAFPTHAEISKCHSKQKFKVPLLIVSINDSKHVHAFLYFFT